MHYRFLAVLSHSLASLLRTAIGFAYAYRISFKVYDAHNIVLLELTPHIGDAYGKNADCLVGCKYFCGAIVDVQFAFGKPFTVGYPLLYAGYRLGSGNEAGVS